MGIIKMWFSKKSPQNQYEEVCKQMQTMHTIQSRYPSTYEYRCQHTHTYVGAYTYIFVVNINGSPSHKLWNTVYQQRKNLITSLQCLKQHGQRLFMDNFIFINAYVTVIYSNQAFFFLLLPINKSDDIRLNAKAFNGQQRVKN